MIDHTAIVTHTVRTYTALYYTSQKFLELHLRYPMYEGYSIYCSSILLA